MNIFLIFILLHSGELYVTKTPVPMTKEQCNQIAYTLIKDNAEAVKRVACVIDNGKEV